MSEGKYTILMNAFRPAQPVDDPRFFAGRARQVAELTNALHAVGTTPLIYGDRGLGKTSLAAQMMNIALGAVDLLSTLGLQDRAFNQTQYLAFPVTCTDSTQDFNGLLQQLINSAEDANSVQRQPSYRARHLAERTTSHRISLKLYEVTTTGRFIPEEARPSYQVLSPTEKFEYLIGHIVDTYRQPVLFVIDELERLKNTRGLASFIKAMSSEFVKFMLVGIASNVGDLLADHQSIERSLWPVRVPLMNNEELGEIVDNAQAYLNRNSIDVQFPYIVKSALVEYAAGFPWFVHVLGQSALLKAREKHSHRMIAGGEQDGIEVRLTDVIDTTYDISNNQFAQQFSNMYSRIVRESARRETVLRAFAEWPDVDIPTSEVNRILKSVLGVRNPSTYKSQLTSREFGSVIYTPEGRHRGEVRFANGMFKVYVRLAPPIFEGVDDRVRTAFDALKTEPNPQLPGCL